MIALVSKQTAAVGVYDHWGWTVLVTVARDALIDRRRVELVDPDLPKFPHHHEGQRMPLQEAVALVERVRVSVRRKAQEALETLASAVPISITDIAIRRSPPLPPAIADRITDYRAHNVADSVMYRDALIDAAEARDWRVHRYDTKTVFAEAASALELASIDGLLRDAGRSAGRPWQKDHKVAMAAAIAASRSRRVVRAK
jgi:hypothetical protein